MSDLEKIRKKCKEHNIKIWTRNEIYKEYHKTKKDRNYLYLKLIGKPFFLISPTYDGLISDEEYVAYEDLEPYIVKK